MRREQGADDRDDAVVVGQELVQVHGADAEQQERRQVAQQSRGQGPRAGAVRAGSHHGHSRWSGSVLAG